MKDWRRGATNGNSKLAGHEAATIRRRRDLGESCNVLAREFEIHPSTVWLIGKRKLWAHVA